MKLNVFEYFCVVLFHLSLQWKYTIPQLLINVQNQGGEVIRETITSYVVEDMITLEFQRTDGTLITQLIDFRNEVQILKALVLGEEERGENSYHTMCFVTRFNKNDFISSDAMAKLRQKNPSTIRMPEEDRGKENYTMTAWVLLQKSGPISKQIKKLCSDAEDFTYIRENDIKAWTELSGSSISSLMQAVQSFPIKSLATSSLSASASSIVVATKMTASKCSEVSAIWAPCLCTLEVCIGWYPCGLKYCKGKNGAASENAINNVRCGIKTCRKCNHFVYYVRQKQQCLWDE